MEKQKHGTLDIVPLWNRGFVRLHVSVGELGTVMVTTMVFKTTVPKALQDHTSCVHGLHNSIWSLQPTLALFQESGYFQH